MKKILFLLLAAFVTTISFSQTSTYILVRHAEKDTSVKTNRDPALSKEGEQRAMNLVEALKDYKIDAVYSTNYVRTKSTVAPIAKKYGQDVQTYNPSEAKAFNEQLLAMKGKTILIVGHSNTVPGMINLLLKEQKFKDLDDSVYNKIFVVTVNGDKAEVKVLEY
jgi:2,3-bisphosphoglycerate-dependent phosphoglycerate mutase